MLAETARERPTTYRREPALCDPLDRAPARLDHVLRSFSPPAAAWASWQEHETMIDRTTFEQVRARLLDPGVEYAWKDAVMRALVRECAPAARATAAATMTIAACLYPGLSRLVRRYADVLGSEETWAVAVAELVGRAGRYDIVRRPDRVAANLMWDTRHAVALAVGKELAWRERVELDLPDGTPATDALGFESDLLGEAVRSGVLGSVDAVLISATRLDGLRLREVAALLGLSYEAAKKRRQRAEWNWGSWWIVRNDPDTGPQPVTWAA